MYNTHNNDKNKPSMCNTHNNEKNKPSMCNSHNNEETTQQENRMLQVSLILAGLMGCGESTPSA